VVGAHRHSDEGAFLESERVRGLKRQFHH
jgi:hypothetical protein